MEPKVITIEDKDYQVSIKVKEPGEISFDRNGYRITIKVEPTNNKPMAKSEEDRRRDLQKIVAKAEDEMLVDQPAAQIAEADAAHAAETVRSENYDDATARLETALRAWRRQQSETRGWPPYRIFTETTLRGLLEKQPQTLVDLKKVAGLGKKKIDQFGESLLEVIVKTLAG